MLEVEMINPIKIYFYPETEMKMFISALSELITTGVEFEVHRDDTEDELFIITLTGGY
tara:strand:+ start:604 stop:777 length:174 start_codon:yes stop_codon:yes gene_type:complete